MVKGEENTCIVAGVQDIPNGLFSHVTDLLFVVRNNKQSRIRTDSAISTLLQG